MNAMLILVRVLQDILPRPAQCHRGVSLTSSGQQHDHLKDERYPKINVDYNCEIRMSNAIMMLPWHQRYILDIRYLVVKFLCNE